jgi:beta-lactamase regulating signal transducer with metallopeptidase domain
MPRNTSPSILNRDQLDHILARNQTFLRDFLLVIGAVVVFIIIIVFILLLFNINKTIELEAQRRAELEKTYLANLDLRTRDYVRPQISNQSATITEVPTVS